MSCWDPIGQESRTRRNRFRVRASCYGHPRLQYRHPPRDTVKIRCRPRALKWQFGGRVNLTVIFGTHVFNTRSKRRCQNPQRLIGRYKSTTESKFHFLCEERTNFYCQTRERCDLQYISSPFGSVFRWKKDGKADNPNRDEFLHCRRGFGDTWLWFLLLLTFRQYLLELGRSKFCFWSWSRRIPRAKTFIWCSGILSENEPTHLVRECRHLPGRFDKEKKKYPTLHLGIHD